MTTNADNPSPERIDEILRVHFDYYKKLDSAGKEKFVGRVQKFMKEKEFFPRGNIDITGNMDEIKTLISAAAVQLTFGLDEFMMDHFSKVFIYPSAFYNSKTQHYHMGETNIMGAIVFSWRDFEEGYQNPTDKINVGVHEMAHALLLNRKTGDDNDSFFTVYFNKWWMIAKEEFEKLENHQKSFFRNYAGTNSNEFFAVCMECFFEAPEEFSEKHPEIYRQTCILLNQDPTGRLKPAEGVRTYLLNNLKVAGQPENLQYATHGKGIDTVIFSSLLLAIPFFFVAFASDTTLSVWPWVIGFAVIIILAEIVPGYVSFSFYDNAFAIGHERLGKKIGSDLVISPERMVDACLYSGNKGSMWLRIDFIEDGRLVNKRWRYDYLRSRDITGLEGHLSAFCSRYKIGFINQE